MKKLGAILLILGAFVIGGTASAGSDPRCTICHFPSHDSEQVGDVLVVGASAWEQSHWLHGDCEMGVPREDLIHGGWFEGVSDDGDETCYCQRVRLDPSPQ